MSVYEEFDINADVVVAKGSAHQRVRPGDTGVVLAKTYYDAHILIDRTQRRAWLRYRDIRCTRLGGWKAEYDKDIDDVILRQTGNHIKKQCLNEERD